jgi:hypothetical protein
MSRCSKLTLKYWEPTKSVGAHWVPSAAGQRSPKDFLTTILNILEVTLTLHSGYEMRGACLFWMENACWLGRLPPFETDTRALRLHYAHVTIVTGMRDARTIINHTLIPPLDIDSIKSLLKVNMISFSYWIVNWYLISISARERLHVCLTWDAI